MSATTHNQLWTVIDSTNLTKLIRLAVHENHTSAMTALRTLRADYAAIGRSTAYLCILPDSEVK